MPIYDLLVYDFSTFNFADPSIDIDQQGPLPASVIGSTFTTSATASDSYTISVDDDDNTLDDGFQEPGPLTQVLDQSVTVGTVTYAAGQTIESEFQMLVEAPDGSQFSIYVIAIGPGENDGDNIFISVEQGFSLQPGETYEIISHADGAAVPYIDLVTCFTSGTNIETDTGNVPVEKLSVGDKVWTLDHGYQAIRWIGSRKVAGTKTKAPVVIKEGTIGNTKDLIVSQQHRILISGWKAELLFGTQEVLTAAKHLVNGDSVYIQEQETVEYFHIMFDQHEIVRSNGALSESFHPGEMGLAGLGQETCKEILDIFPELDGKFDKFGGIARVGLKSYEAKLL